MKKLISLSLAFVLLMFATYATADIDLSNLSYEELVDLVNRAQYEMMKSDKWQKVTVPEGTYQIGCDIPAGHWTITVPDQGIISIAWGIAVQEGGVGIDFKSVIAGATLIGKRTNIYNEGTTYSVSYNLEEGQYIDIMQGSAIFTPYQGNGFEFQ